MMNLAQQQLFSVLLPKDKLEHFPVNFTRFLVRLNLAFGGYTIDGQVTGAWRDLATGAVHNDVHLVVSVAIPSYPAARIFFDQLVAQTAVDLDELAIFIASAGSTYFAWARSTDINAALAELMSQRDLPTAA